VVAVDARGSDLRHKYPQFDNIDLPTRDSYQVQVVAHSGTDQSYTLIEVDEPEPLALPAPTVVAHRDDPRKRTVVVMTSDTRQDNFPTVVIGATGSSRQIQVTRAEETRINNQIDSDPLRGCAPLSLACERTSTRAAQNSSKPTTSGQAKQPKRRLKVTP